VVDVEADQIAFGIVVQDYAFRDFPTLDTRLFREVDVQRVRLGMVVEFQGLNLLS